jgi:hypothetical protein
MLPKGKLETGGRIWTRPKPPVSSQKVGLRGWTAKLDAWRLLIPWDSESPEVQL